MTEEKRTPFADRLLEAIERKGNPCMVGLDPRFEDIPHSILERVRTAFGDTVEAAAHALFVFNREIIDIVADRVPAVKPQFAFYELFGAPGVKAFADTIRYARQKGLLTIADVKRNDIGSTVAASSHAFLGRTSIWDGREEAMFDADAVTVNGWLGSDGITPFLDDCQRYGKGIFVLVKTSNKSSAEFQNLLVDGEPLYIHVARKCAQWGENHVGSRGFSSVGVVVGATYPAEAEAVRAVLPQAIFLVPGFGFQGGKAEDLQRFCHHGSGIIINSSRGIIHAYQQKPWSVQFGEEGYRQAISAALDDMIDNVRRALGQ